MAIILNVGDVVKITHKPSEKAIVSAKSIELS